MHRSHAACDVCARRAIAGKWKTAPLAKRGFHIRIFCCCQSGTKPPVAIGRRLLTE